MARHFDELNTLLEETRFLKNSPPIFDFNIEGYSALHTPTKSSAGGALLYVSNWLSYFPRSDRSDLSDILYKPKDIESVFIEVSFSN